MAAAYLLSLDLAAAANDALLEAKCQDVALHQLSVWQASGEYLQSSDSTDDLVVLRSPTSKVGTWVLVMIANGRVDRLLAVSQDSETEAVFDDQCHIEVSVHSRPLPPRRKQQWLTDEDVASIVAANDKGVFYAWSPHMPLSVDGYAEITAAVKTLGLSLTPVLSSHANVEYAKDRAGRIDMPEEGFALNRSVELTMRSLTVHAPAILIHANGKFVSPVIPGFRRAPDYEALIMRFLEN